VGVGSGPPDRSCIVYHGTDELPVEQHTIPDGQTTPPVEEGAKHTQSLRKETATQRDTYISSKKPTTATASSTMKLYI
jgi:hypothetical protein